MNSSKIAPGVRGYVGRILVAAAVAIGSFASPGDTAPATFVRAPYDVVLTNLRILSETPVSATETEVRFTTNLTNLDTGVYTNLSVNVSTAGTPVPFAVTDPILDFASLPPAGTAQAGAGSLAVVSASADVASVRAFLLGGSALYVTAQEIPVFAGPTKFVDEPTDLAFASHSTNGQGKLVLVFSSATVLATNLNPGEFLVANPNPGAYVPKTGAVDDLVRHLPFEVDSVTVAGVQVAVVGNRRSLAQTVRSGTFLGSDENYNNSGRDLYDPPLENTFTAAEAARRRADADVLEQSDPLDLRLADLRGMTAIPWHFNDLAIGSWLRLSGEVLFRSSGLRFQASFRDFALKKLAFGIDAGVEASLLLETTGVNDSASGQARLASIPLPPLPVNVAGVPCEIQPVLVITVGAEASGPDALAIPLRSSVRVGTEIGWDGGSFFVAPTREFSAPRLSDPTIFSAVHASAHAWAEAKLDVRVGTLTGEISAAPSLAVRADARFAMEPLADPWWTVDLEGSLVGGLELQAFGVPLAHGTTPLAAGTFLHLDAGGSLGHTVDATTVGDPTVSKAGRSARWAIGFNTSNRNDSFFYDSGFVVALPDGGCLVGGESPYAGFLARVSDTGEFLWEQLCPNGVAPRFAALLPDGAVAVAGTYLSQWWLARYSPDGTRDWVQSLNTSTLRGPTTLGGLVAGTDAGGEPEIAVAGYNLDDGALGRDPVLFRFATNGTFLAGYSLTGTEDDYVSSVTALRDGGEVLVGHTDANVVDGAFGDYNGNGLILKVDDAGQVVWARALAGPAAYNHVVESPDGSLYAVGTALDNLGHFPSILVSKWSPTGDVLGHVVIAEDPDWTSEFASPVDQAYDTAMHVEWTPNGPLLVGVTGNGPTRSGWAAQLTDELGVAWFTAFENGAAGVLYDLAAGTKGFCAMGWYEGLSSTFNNPARQGILLVKMPWEGLMRFATDTGLAGRYLQPRIGRSSEFQEFSIGPNAVSVAELSFASTPLGFTAGPLVATNTPAEFPSVRLERIPSAPSPSYRQWAASHQLVGAAAAPAADPDGDGAVNGAEFFSGTDPTVPDSAGARLAVSYDPDRRTVNLEFRRARIAASVAAEIETTADLAGWKTVAEASPTVVETVGETDRLRVTLAAPERAGYFRLRVHDP